MSLPVFSTQSELFSTAALSACLFATSDRYRLFAKLVYPHLVRARATLEQCYCLENGRVGLEPVLMLGVSLLQYLDGVPDRQAVEMLRYHAGWNFALNRQLGDEVFHPTSLVNFRNRLEEHQQRALGFTTILQALEEAGLVSRHSRQRLDSLQMLGRVARMSRLDCVRESLRLALEELESTLPPEARPAFWTALWECYVESQVDYRAGGEVLSRKLTEAGRDAWQLLQWLGQPACAQAASGPQAQLLQRVFGEQFEVVAGTPLALSRPKGPPLPGRPETPASAAGPMETSAGAAQSPPPPPSATEAAAPPEPPVPPPAAVPPVVVEPKPKGQLDSARVQNPHEPEATYSVKGQGEKKKEHVGYKIQVAETVTEVVLAAGEPTRNFIVGIVTHPAYEHDEVGSAKMEQEQGQMGLEKPPVQYVDSAYVSAQKLAQAQAEGREIIGPALLGPSQENRFTAVDFQIHVEERKAVCPAGQSSTQCSRLVEASTGKINYRFEFSTQCHDCRLRPQCVAQGQRHRTVLVGEHHTFLQSRRQEQQTPAFKQRLKHRNAIEGTQSELVRGHGMRQARYRGLAKTKLQNYFTAAACNVKRWIRREVWTLQETALALAPQAVAESSS
jgi:IS5 family transposase